MSTAARAPVSGELARFQDAFASALFARDAVAAPEIAALAAQPAFSVYRNTVMKGCIDALQANYPAVARITGEDWFRAAAAIFVRGHLPQTPMLLEYGARFAEFLAGFEPAAGLTYLPGVAQLDRCWNEAHGAPDEHALDPDALADFAPEALGETVLRPHAAARWGWFAEAPIYTIWSRNRNGRTCDEEIEWRGEGALLVRPGASVEWQPLDAAGCAFLDACAAGGTLADAAGGALAVDGDADLASLLARLLAAGAFGGMSRHNASDDREDHA